MPSSNTARLAAFSSPLAVIITSVGLTARASAQRQQFVARLDPRRVGLAQRAPSASCSASGAIRSMRPSARPRSISAASCSRADADVAALAYRRLGLAAPSRLAP